MRTRTTSTTAAAVDSSREEQESVHEGEGDDGEERSVHRSPAYPFVSLQAAIDRAKQIYDADKHHPVRYDTIAKRWGYAAKSSGTSQTVGALRQFGLLEVKSGQGRDRYFKLADAAIRILTDKREIERLKVIREAALRPKLYAELWSKWGEHPPSDDTAESYLAIERRFNPTYVKSILGNYKATVDLARLANSGTVEEVSSQGREDQEGSENDMDTERVEPSREKREAPTVAGEQEIFRTNLVGGRVARVLLRGPAPTRAQIDKLIALLELTKDQYPENEQSGT